MKKKSFIIAALIIGMIACIASCKKKTTDPTPEPTPEPTEYVCTHDTTLVHVLAAEPTEEENGCIEHWECPICLATFADAEAKTPITNTILWATNYVIDDENIYGNYFKQFAGNETYMSSAFSNMPGILGDDGALWYDYTDWHDWTESQWDVYWAYMNEYYKELGGEGNLNDGENLLSTTAVEAFATRIMVREPDDINSSMGVFFEETSDGFAIVNTKIDAIIREVDNIQSSLSRLAQKFNDDKYIKVLNEREQRQIPLNNITMESFRNILLKMQEENATEGKTVPFSQLSEQTMTYITELAENWHNEIVSGNQSEVELMNMLGFMTDSSFGMELPDAYDEISLRSSGWKHEAQNIMEVARCADVVLIAECYLMNYIYYYTHPQYLSLFQDGVINRLILDYVKLLDMDNKGLLERNDSSLSCTIPGVDGIFEKELKKVEANHYIETHSEFRLQRPADMEAFINYCTDYKGMKDKEWFKTLCQYYREKKENNLADVLKDVGFILPDDNPIIICDYKGEYTKEGGGYYKHRVFSFYSKQTVSVFNYDWLKFRTRVILNLNNLSVFEEVSIASDMCIKLFDDHKIKEAGTPYEKDGKVDEYYTLKVK